MTLRSRALEPDPQAIALLLAVLPNKVGGGVLGGLHDQLRSEVALSFALLDQAPSPVIEHAKHVLPMHWTSSSPTISMEPGAWNVSQRS